MTTQEDGMVLVERLRDEAVYASPRFEKLFTEAASRIEQLERELAEAYKDNEIATRHVTLASEALSAVGAELSVEKALADRLAEWLDYLNTRSKSSLSDEDADMALEAHRKARGL